MREEPFELRLDGGVLHGHRAGAGAPALLLHGGAAVPDYLGGCAAELDGLFATIRYTQRGTPPSEAGPPYSVESHMDDALAVLDARGIDRAWAIGHSWGGHLALHLLVAHPERLHGVLCVDPLGADSSVFADFQATIGPRLSEDEIVRLRDVEELRRAGQVSEADLVERFAVVWRFYFAGHEPKLPPPVRVGVEASIGTNASLDAHFERQTLARGLPEVRLPALFVHGEDDPLPVRSSAETAALIPGALVETIPDCGHFPWVEQPAAFRAAVERLLGAVS